MTEQENNILGMRLDNLIKELDDKGIFGTRNLKTEDHKKSFAFVVYCAQRFCDNYNVDEIIDDVTDGSQDQNIDICNIQDNDEKKEVSINLFQCKYKNSQNLTKTIGETDVKLFLASVKDIFIESTLSENKLNCYLRNQYKIFKDLVTSYSSGNVRFNLFLVTNGADINEQEITVMNDFAKSSLIHCKWELKNTYAFFGEKPEYTEDIIKIPLRDSIIKYDQGGITACIANFKTYDLAKLYEQFGNSIFNKNVRGLLKSKTNKEIEESLTGDPEMFWCKNNGLSIVCESFEQKQAGGKINLILRKPYIVNGGQTTKTIYNLYKNVDKNNDEDMSSFYNSYVMARIYQTTDDDKVATIAYSTNNQNKVTSFDLKSLNQNLRQIKTFFELNHISLLIQRDSAEIKKPDSINSDLLLQVYCSFYKEIPHEAKTSKEKLIQNYYDDVFKNNTISKNLLIAYKVYKYVKDENKKKEDEFIKHAMFSILYLIGIIEPNIKNEYNEDIASKAYNESLKIISSTIVQENSTQKNFTFNNFFKSGHSTTTLKTMHANKVNNHS